MRPAEFVASPDQTARLVLAERRPDATSWTYGSWNSVRSFDRGDQRVWSAVTGLGWLA